MEGHQCAIVHKAVPYLNFHQLVKTLVWNAKHAHFNKVSTASYRLVSTTHSDLELSGTKLCLSSFEEDSCSKRFL